MIMLDSCRSWSAESRRVEEMELKYHEMSWPPPRRVTAFDFTFGIVGVLSMTTIEGPSRLARKEEDEAAGRGGIDGAATNAAGMGARGCNPGT